MAIIPGYVAVPAQSKSLDTNIVTTTEGIVHRQVVNISDPQSPTTHMTVGANGAYVDVRNVIALPLPSGAATSALQTTGNTSLSTIITNTTGVSTAANQTTGNASLSTIATNTTGLNSLTKNTGIVDANTIRVSPATDVTQAISAVSLPLPTGAATSALQTTGNTSLSSIDTKTPSLSSGRVPVESNLVQALTDSQLRATPVPISFARLSSAADSVSATQSGTWNVNNISGTVSLPTGAATESTLAALSNKFNTNSFSNINTNTTTVVKSGSGVLKRIVVNKVGGASNTCTIYNNTSGTGTIIATIDPVHTQMVFEYDVVFNTGLTIVTATGTAADLTIVYQ